MIAAQDALQILLRITAELGGHAELELALQAVTDAVLELITCEHASIRLLDDNADELVAGARSGAGSTHAPLTFRRGEGVVGWVAAHGEAVRLGDAGSDPRFKVAQNQGFGVRSILAVPLRSGGKVIGVLSMASSAPHAFGPDDETMARLLANCSVPPIEHARLARLTLTDDTTATFNRRYYTMRLHEEMERARRGYGKLTILFLDLDHFKRVNDEHGHDVGDLVLKAFADQVRATVRRYDVLIRRSGEEFILVMPSTGWRQGQVVASRVKRALQTVPLRIGPTLQLVQTASIGVAEWDLHESASELELRADHAMYEAKRAGRNRVCVSPAPRTTA